jgi:HD-GYP domain-containing protein (c-di-GMP phosphodiesterase class II)
LFSIIGIVIFGVLNTGFMLALPYLAPEIFPDYSMIIEPLAVSAIAIVLLVIAKNHRNRIERARQEELKLAYNTTLEGWARALELRDKETEGHSQRLTELTLELARALGIRGQNLDHIHRGSLLQDIGKLGVPDLLLQKNDRLTSEEFEVVKRHPILA